MKTVSSVLALPAAFVAAVVIACGLVYLLPLARRWHATWLAERALLVLPYVVMSYPGIRRLISRRWLSGVILLIAGWLMATGVLYISGLILWTLPWRTR